MVNPFFIGELVSLIGLLAAFAIFLRLAIKSWNVDGRKFRSMKFAISLSVLLWIVPEGIIIQLQNPQLIVIFVTQGLIYPVLHSASMAVLAGVVLLKGRRVIRLVRR